MNDKRDIETDESKDKSQVRQKRMIADHFEKLARAKAEGKKVVYTFVPGNVTEPVSYTHLTLPTNREV